MSISATVGDAEHQISSPHQAQPGTTENASRLIKQWAFALSFMTLAGVVGGVSFLLSFLIHIGVPLCGSAPCAQFRPYLPVLVFAALARAILFLVRRPYRSRRRGYAEEAAEALREGVLGSIAIVVFTFFWRGGARFRTFSYARGVFLLDWMLATAGLALALLLMKKVLGTLRQKGHNVRNVAIVGGSRTARSFMREIADHPETGYRVVAVVDDPHIRNRRSVDELARLVEHRAVDEVILASSAVDRSDISRLLGIPVFRRVDVQVMPELFGVPPAKATVVPAGDFPMLCVTNEPLPVPSRLLKRSMDLLLGTLALVALTPLMAIAAFAVRVSSRGPVFFRQERVGMDGRPFRMIKFRTMFEGADSRPHEEYVASLIAGTGQANGSKNVKLFKLVEDHRVTPVGRMLRRLSLDELPQLFNVLRGDMSLVGPRPPLGYEVALYQDWHRRRLDVRPGITGLWQVSGRSRLSHDDMVRLDIHYIETWSPGRDLLILLRTIPAILRKDAS